MDDKKPYGHDGFPTPGFQTPNADTVLDTLFFLTEAEWEQAKTKCDYDIVIVGSGFCALAVAERALKNDHSCRILIIERGPFFLPSHIQNLGKPFDQTIAGNLETFPWTMSAKTAQGDAGIVRYQHGMIPCFGGRSVMWSAWCPEPSQEEMHEWPVETIQNLQENKRFEDAKRLLHVEGADSIAGGSKESVYGELQTQLQDLLEQRFKKIKGVYHTEAAPLAVDGRFTGIEFAKYSVPSELMQLVKKQKGLDIVTNCIVEKIYQQKGMATALQTSRGVIALGAANLVLAMGTLPTTTLVRNSFPYIPATGKRFGAHFISAIIARVPRDDFWSLQDCQEFELGAFYIAGKAKDFNQQYHIQLTAISDKNPEQNAKKSLRFMPDVVATATEKQLLESEDYIVFVCAVLGELDVTNPDSWFLQNNDDTDLTTNSMLQVAVNHRDMETWDAMDNATFGILEKVLCDGSEGRVQYWHKNGEWTGQRPSEKDRRVDKLVHECSTLHIGEEYTAPVDLSYCLRSTKHGSGNVYVTGGALWPRSASWNPTLTMVALAQHLADNLTVK